MTIQKSTYKPGDTVYIYTDPLTCKMKEGPAELISYHRTLGSLEVWNVIFDDCRGRIFRRMISFSEN